MEIRVLREKSQRKLTNQMICYGEGSGQCTLEEAELWGKLKQLWRKIWPSFYHTCLLLLVLFIALQTEAALWFAIEGEYRPEGSWNIYSLAVASWLWMDKCCHYRTVIVFNWTICIWLSWRLLHGCQKRLNCFYCLHGWLRKNIGYWNLALKKTYSHVCSHTSHTTAGKLYLAGVATGLWAIISELSD